MSKKLSGYDDDDKNESVSLPDTESDDKHYDDDDVNPRSSQGLNSDKSGSSSRDVDFNPSDDETPPSDSSGGSFQGNMSSQGTSASDSLSGKSGIPEGPRLKSGAFGDNGASASQSLGGSPLDGAAQAGQAAGLDGGAGAPAGASKGLLGGLKSSLGNALGNLGHGAVNGTMGIFNGAVHFASAAVQSVGVVAATTTAGLGVAAAATLGVALFADTAVPYYPPIVDPCEKDWGDTSHNGDVNGAHGDIAADEVTKQRIKTAKAIYGVFYKWHDEMRDKDPSLPVNIDAEIAGILGNWQVESGLDYTSIETAFGEPYHIGKNKRRIIDLDYKWDPGECMRIYGHLDNPVAVCNTIKRRGIGFGQWTDTTEAEGKGRNSLLRAFAENDPHYKDSRFDGKSPDELEAWMNPYAQLEFMMAKNGDPSSRREFMTLYLSGKSDIPGKSSNGNGDTAETAMAAAKVFGFGFEGNVSSSLATRQSYAKEWFARIRDSFDKNGDDEKKAADAVRSLEELGAATGIGAAHAAKDKLKDTCTVTKAISDNSSAAKAAVSIAYDTNNKGRFGTPADPSGWGTYWYQEVHQKVYPGDGYYRSCDRTVGTALRWSDTDPKFPPGPVIEQNRYMNEEGASQWEHVESLDSQVAGSKEPPKDLKPGDVLLHIGAGQNQHIIIYTGNDVVRALRPKAVTKDAVIVSGSFTDRAPNLETWLGSGVNSGTYKVWRHKDTGKSEKVFSDFKPSSDHQIGEGPASPGGDG